MRYIANEFVPSELLASLRESVGWNRMEKELSDPKLSSLYHIAAYKEDKLVGYIDCISNGVTDAYIQDLMVHPEYQGQGVGSELMNRMIDYLKANKVYMISVVFDESLKPFYERFGFYTMLSGQMETYENE